MLRAPFPRLVGVSMCSGSGTVVFHRGDSFSKNKNEVDSAPVLIEDSHLNLEALIACSSWYIVYPIDV